ncbi:methyl-accepting chemotaxis protein [Sporosarcina obsidiansis]|uniref:methyl-accepting chemotaxis protein n=1 Tax=Sporosarcina obsidiansis TaxID=2660748 RepID=UPI001890F1A4|nr:methyl-accepting chemotaxis protein [Sporosarcina obsidiansis]
MKFTVGKKLWGGFLSVVFLMILIGIVGFFALSNVNDRYQFLIDDRMYKVVLLEQQLKDQNALASNIRGYMLYENPAYLEEIENAKQNNAERLKILEEIIRNKDMKKALMEISAATVNYEGVLRNVVTEVQAGNSQKALQIGTNGAIYQDVISRNIHTLIEHQTTERDNLQKEVNSYTANAIIFSGILILIGVIVSITITIIISRLISRPVRQMTEALTEVSNGNFALEEVTVKNRDEIGDMSIALNKMVHDLRGIIQRARDSAVQLAVQSEELSASAEESLAASEMVAEISEKNLQTSDSQAQIVSQSTLSMKEMITAIDQITDDNEEMLGSSEEVSKLVREGSLLMEEFSNEMKTISQTIGESTTIIHDMAGHSENIRNVTRMITDIAEQTNLLALNAAIEAARAGEHGKGFAVVAEEVRNLAEQSKRSAEDIGRMIDTMIQNVTKAVNSTGEGRKRVDEGLSSTEKTSTVFMNIEQATTDVSEKISTVSAAIEEIRAMTDEVANGAKQVEELAIQASAEAQSTSAATEQQLAANEEITSSSQTLAELAEQLQNDMGRFQV